MRDPPVGHAAPN